MYACVQSTANLRSKPPVHFADYCRTDLFQPRGLFFFKTKQRQHALSNAVKKRCHGKLESTHRNHSPFFRRADPAPFFFRSESRSTRRTAASTQTSRLVCLSKPSPHIYAAAAGSGEACTHDTHNIRKVSLNGKKMSWQWMLAGLCWTYRQS